jgi:TrmH family RNA methyltransferase
LTDLLRGHPLVVVLDEVQDPGNAGAIVRAAEAFGATGAIFIKGSVSPYNPKTLRASAGSLFRFPVLAGMDASCARSQLVENGIELFAAVPAHTGAAPISAADLMRECAVVIGNEARGVSELWRSSARAVSIPTTSVESLNAAVAAGILLYEARRQRSSAA